MPKRQVKSRSHFKTDEQYKNHLYSHKSTRRSADVEVSRFDRMHGKRNMRNNRTYWG